MSGVVDVLCCGCLMWWMSGLVVVCVVNVWSGGCLVCWMPYFTHGVVDVWCGECPVGVVNILFYTWWIFGVVDVWCYRFPILHKLWWMSGVVVVCVVDVVQSGI